jgi:hypothetical protein
MKIVLAICEIKLIIGHLVAVDHSIAVNIKFAFNVCRFLIIVLFNAKNRLLKLINYLDHRVFGFRFVVFSH